MHKFEAYSPPLHKKLLQTRKGPLKESIQVGFSGRS